MVNYIPGVYSFSWNFEKNYRAPDFADNVFGNFSCFYTEIAYSNFTFCGAYTLSFLALHTILDKASTPQFF